MKYLSVLAAFLFVSPAFAQQNYPLPNACPVLSPLASSKFHVADADSGDESIVIWYWNQGKKVIHGVEFLLIMLDTAGNRYLASQAYQANGNVEPKHGDVVTFPAKDEQQFLGDKWERIDGVEVHVTKILFADATTWAPAKGVVCKTVFLNENYDKAMERFRKDAEKSSKP